MHQHQELNIHQDPEAAMAEVCLPSICLLFYSLHSFSRSTDANIVRFGLSLSPAETYIKANGDCLEKSFELRTRH
jgi:hypothetical protein